MEQAGLGVAVDHFSAVIAAQLAHQKARFIVAVCQRPKLCEKLLTPRLIDLAGLDVLHAKGLRNP